MLQEGFNPFASKTKPGNMIFPHVTAMQLIAIKNRPSQLGQLVINSYITVDYEDHSQRRLPWTTAMQCMDG